MGSDPSVWQLTDCVIDAEDVFELQVDARSTGSATTNGNSWLGLDNVRLYDLEGR